jgi:hypothetical protein
VPATVPTAELLKRAQSLYASLDYEQVIHWAAAVLARADATMDERLDAYLLQGSSLAVVGDPIEAEKPFRFLLRGRPDFDLSAKTPPKILAVFRKVQVEERSIAQQMRELERERTIKELQLTSETPDEAKGGQPLAFEYHLQDPRRAVSSVQVHYRRAPSEPFSALALQIDPRGAWRGSLPGDWTASRDGFTLQYYVTTLDEHQQQLLTVGGATSPLDIAVTPGRVEVAVPFYKEWWFWSAAVGVVAGAGVSGYLLYHQATSLPQTAGRVDLKE